MTKNDILQKLYLIQKNNNSRDITQSVTYLKTILNFPLLQKIINDITSLQNSCSKNGNGLSGGLLTDIYHRIV